MLRAHVLSIACLGRLSLPGAEVRDPGPGYFLSQKVASYHIHECCNSVARWPELYYHHGIPVPDFCADLSAGIAAA